MNDIFATKKFMSLLQRLFEKYATKNMLFQIEQNHTNLLVINLFAKSFSRALKRDITSHHYQFSVIPERIIKRKDKLRTVYPLNITDKLVQMSIVSFLNPLLQRQLSPHCYAYVPGKSNLSAVKAFANYLRQRSVDIFLLRTDITNYTDSIPLGENSILWTCLRSLCQQTTLSVSQQDYLHQLIKQALRPLAKTASEYLYQKIIGLPMGTPLTTIVANLYLTPIDKKIAAIPEIFYARYGDDILIAHHNPSLLLEAETLLTTELTQLGLDRSKEKTLNLYFTRAGKACVDPNWHGTNRIEYLGYSINRRGNIGLNRTRFARTMFDLYQRIENYHSLLKNTENNPCIELCQLVNNLLDINYPLHEKNLIDILKAVDDRGQLKQMDFLIAKKIAEKLSGILGIKAFSKISYTKLRNKYGLKSLVVIKNHFW